ncbi:hypothetical protein ACH4E5_13910 [Streptomyces afghaniensis]|uniref:hypothetical protein n=1 Tax=Streptomyces afghaniensis TaxID=66865 RepID=UPI0037B6AC8C
MERGVVKKIWDGGSVIPAQEVSSLWSARPGGPAVELRAVGPAITENRQEAQRTSLPLNYPRSATFVMIMCSIAQML